jgi:hypothetical protein
MRTTLVSETLRLRPGVAATLDVEVTNTSAIIDGLTAVVLGLEPAWVQLTQPVVTLFPEATGTLTLRFDVPPSCPAGESAITIRILSTIEPDRFVEHVVWLVVEAVELAELEMRPSLVEAGSHAGMQAVIINQGNAVSELSVTALEPTRALECRVSPPTLQVAPGEVGQVTVLAHGKRPWFGSNVERAIQVTATSPTLELTASARFVQKPRIPRGVITTLILVLIIALWATIFLFAIKYLRAGADPAKTVSATWPTGAREVNLADVAATVSGTLTAESTGEPLARIIVEAYRSSPTGKPVLVGSAATGDDGNYELGALLPGKYRLRFSSAGFAPLWYPDAAAEADAEEFELAPIQTRSGLDGVVAGQPGTLIGQIAAPNGAAPGEPAKVTVTLIPASPDQPVPPPQEVTTGGQFEVGGLETPARYEVRIERPGFDVQIIETELGGGQAAVLDTTNLLAADGSIAGRVVDGAGNALGGVTVVVRSGTDERTITTPTVGNVGGFNLDGLETPRTYVLTFSLEGYTSATVALDLSGGEQRTGVSAVLVGGAGSVQGTARTVGGQPLGGVSVLVQGRGLQLETATLTSGVGINGVGSYSLSGLLAPGTYSVTFSRAGYQTTTVGVTFDGAGARTGLDVVLAPSTSTISGVATLAAVPQAGLTVTLFDGTTLRSVVTAANPAGAYSFSNVGPGSYTLTISGSGVQTRIVLIEVAQGVDIVRNVSLVAP